MYSSHAENKTASCQKISLPPANVVCEGYVLTPVCDSVNRGACMVAREVEACVVAPRGGMRGCSGGGMHGCSGGACMVAPGGACMVALGACMVTLGHVCGKGGVHGTIE